MLESRELGAWFGLCVGSSYTLPKMTVVPELLAADVFRGSSSSGTLTLLIVARIRFRLTIRPVF